MITQPMVQPSSLIPIGMDIVPLGNVFLFRLTDDLQDRLENLLDQKKADALTDEQVAELEGITELSRIFTLINDQNSEQRLPLSHNKNLNRMLDKAINTKIPQNSYAFEFSE